MIADVSAYEGICPHCERFVPVTWNPDPRSKASWPQSCPLCGAGKRSDDWMKPPMEVALFIAQRRYFEALKKPVVDPSSDARPGSREMGEIYRYLWQYATGRIKQIIQSKVNLLPEVIIDKANDAATMFVERYLKDPDFIIDTSFGVYLDYQIRAVLYSYKEQRVDQTESIHALESGEDRVGDAEIAFVGGKKASTAKGMEQQISRYHLLSELQGLLESGHAMIEFHLSRETSLLFLLYVKSYLTTRFYKKKTVSFDQLYGNEEITAIAGSYLNDLFKYLRMRGKA